MRSPISAEEKLAIILRYVAAGGSLNSLKYQFRIHETTIGKSIIPVCEAIYNVSAPNYMKCPSTKEEWEYIIDQTNSRWQFYVTAGEPKKIPMVFIAGDAFPLTKHCMKPYSRKNLSDEERVFGCRCSRFRRISENAFGIWSNRFKLFATRAC